MRLRYFVIDAQSQIRQVPQSTIEGIWRGAKTLADLNLEIGAELRVITALCDSSLNPRVVFFLRLALDNGAITPQSRQLAYQTVASVISSEGEGNNRSAFAYQIDGWPCDWQRQLAIALDTPAKSLTKIAIGGPLPVSDLMGVSVRESLRYFEKVAGC